MGLVMKFVTQCQHWACLTSYSYEVLARAMSTQASPISRLLRVTELSGFFICGFTVATGRFLKLSSFLVFYM